MEWVSPAKRGKAGAQAQAQAANEKPKQKVKGKTPSLNADVNKSLA